MRSCAESNTSNAEEQLQNAVTLFFNLSRLLQREREREMHFCLPLVRSPDIVVQNVCQDKASQIVILNLNQYIVLPLCSEVDLSVKGQTVYRSLQRKETEDFTVSKKRKIEKQVNFTIDIEKFCFALKCTGSFTSRTTKLSMKQCKRNETIVQHFIFCKI